MGQKPSKIVANAKKVGLVLEAREFRHSYCLFCFRRAAFIGQGKMPEEHRFNARKGHRGKRERWGGRVLDSGRRILLWSSICFPCELRNGRCLYCLVRLSKELIDIVRCL